MAPGCAPPNAMPRLVASSSQMWHCAGRPPGVVDGADNPQSGQLAMLANGPLWLPRKPSLARWPKTNHGASIIYLAVLDRKFSSPRMERQAPANQYPKCLTVPSSSSLRYISRIRWTPFFQPVSWATSCGCGGQTVTQTIWTNTKNIDPCNNALLHGRI